jgi:hypothetical protein
VTVVTQTAPLATTGPATTTGTITETSGGYPADTAAPASSGLLFSWAEW